MDAHSEHSSDNTFGSLSRGPSLTEKHSLTAADSKKHETKLTMAYEKGLMKERCGFCKMYFHRNSVNYKVPNHRIFDLERKWNVKREGRRYSNAGFLYKMVDVCCFCSQFFKIMPENLPVLESKESKEKPLKLEINTIIERKDIALNQRVYMSSSVDGRLADIAILPPYDNFSRTRREVDPWWELDFSRQYHVHSLSFFISSSRQKLHVSVFLLNKPYGFEDPFIDSIKGKAIDSLTEIINETNQPTMIPIKWVFPSNTVCTAVRIQIKGIHSMSIQELHIYQGDHLIPTTDETYIQTMNSYSTLSPIAVKQGIIEMMSPNDKKVLIKENDPYINEYDRIKEKYMSVEILKNKIKNKKKNILLWKEKVLDLSSIFTTDEIVDLYRVIFKPALEAKPCPNIDNNILINFENNLLNNSIILHYPRIDLLELYNRLRSIVRWIQTRSHLKVLASLANCKAFETVAYDPNSHIYRLHNIIKTIELYWNKCEINEKRIVEEAATSSSHDGGFVGLKVSEARGCSWSQFLILISLFCTQKTKLIPETAFYLDTIGTTSELAHQQQQQYHQYSMTSPSNDDHSIGSNSDMKSINNTSLSIYSDNNSMNGGRSNQQHHHRSSSTSIYFDEKNWLDRMATPVKLNPPEVIIEPKTFLEKAREKELFPYYNSSFAEYKFWHFQRRSALTDIDFPSELSLEFARSLNPRRAGTSCGRGGGSSGGGGGTLPVLDGGSVVREGGGSGSGGNNREKGVGDDNMSVRSGLSLGTHSDHLHTRPDTSSSINNNRGNNVRISILSAKPNSASRKLRTSQSNKQLLLSSPSIKRTNTNTNLNTPSTKNGGFTSPSTKNGLFTSPSMKNLMSSSLSSLEDAGLGPNRSFLSPSNSFLLSNTAAGISSRPMTTGGFNTPNKNTTNMNNNSISSKNQNNFAIKSGKYTNNNIIKNDEDNYSSHSSDMLSFGDLGEEKHTSKRPATANMSSTTVDFFRVCSLCELKFPRDCMEVKVMRKHVVQLRNSWDPNLVSPEVRLLDHTISMYNLVHVCTFCAQFFDPDFPDGIAYPVRVDSPSPKITGALSAITSQRTASPLRPYYDTRYLANSIEAGEVFSRPHSVEARTRAIRARNIAQKFKEKQDALMEASLNAK